MKCAYVTDRPETLAGYPFFVLTDDESGEALRVTPEKVVLRRDCFLLTAAEIPHRERAQELRGFGVEAPLELVPPRGEGEYFLWELVGLPVRTEDGRTLGTVTDVDSTKAGTILEVSDGAGEHFYLAFEGEDVVRIEKESAIIAALHVGRGHQ